MKKAMSTLLALVMVFAVCVPVTAFGDDATVDDQKYDISFKGDVGHTYAVYQVFTGTYNSQNDTLADIEWGTGVKDTNSLIAALGITVETDQEPAEALAEYLKNGGSTYAAKAARTIGNSYLGEKYVLYTDPTTEKPVTEKTVTSTDTVTVPDCPAGYYLVVDITPNANMGSSAYSSYMLGVSKPGQSIYVKNTAIPTPTKLVTKSSDYSGLAASTTASMGDTVYFQLTATMPTDGTYAVYPSYTLSFADQLSSGLTLKSAPVVKVGTVDITQKATITYGEGQEVGSAGASFSISFSDLKDISSVSTSSVITVTYEATVNAAAAIGTTAGNPNTMTLTYSNDPNKGISGTTATSAVQTATVNTYSYQIVKVKDDKTSIFTDITSEGQYATFQLFNNEDKASDHQIKLVAVSGQENTYRPAITDEEKNNAVDIKAGVATIVGLGNGTYFLKETKAPVGYNTLASTDIISFDVENVNVAVTTSSDKNSYVSGGLSIVNQAGNKLPWTGGMGTIIFTVVGLVLIVGAGSALVIRRRAKANNTK